MPTIDAKVNDTYAVYVPAGSVIFAFVAKNTRTGEWWIMPSAHNGWTLRHSWPAARCYTAATEQDLNIAFGGYPALTAMCIGIPAELVEPGLVERKEAAVAAELARLRIAA